MSTYTICFNGQQQTIKSNHNEDFDKAVSIFKLFDDSVVNISTEQIAAFDPSFKFRFYGGNAIEYYFDTFMMSCFTNNVNLLTLMCFKHVDKLNNEYQYGSDNYTTPFTILVNKYRKMYALITLISAFGDFNKKDSHGELLIEPDNNYVNKIFQETGIKDEKFYKRVYPHVIASETHDGYEENN